MEAMKMNDLVIVGVAVATAAGCTSVKNEYASYELYPVRSGSLTEMEYTSEATHFPYGHLQQTKYVSCCMRQVKVAMPTRLSVWKRAKKVFGTLR